MGLTGLRPSSRRNDQSERSKRKFEKKTHFYAKVKDADVLLGAKKAISKKKRLRSRQKKLKAYDLSALSEFLPDLNDAPQQQSDATNWKLNCKSRLKLVQRESVQLRAVLNDPTFKIDPVSAIQHHLERTQPLLSQSEEKQKPSRKNQKKAKRKGAKRVPSSTDPRTFMDM